MIRLVILLFALGCAGCAREPSAPPKSFSASPEHQVIQMTTMRKAVEEVIAERGSVVIFHVYAAWCAACRSEFPDLVELAKVYRPHGAKVIALAVDEDTAPLEKFLSGHELPFQARLVVKGTDEEFLAPLYAAGLDYRGGIPFTAVFDRNGKLSDQWTGARTLDEFERVIRPLL